jgi:predicted anti-sigma-YlaC factor YlaD
MTPDEGRDPVAEHARLRTDLGAYLVGSLAPAEHAALQRHLPGCADCRAELARLAPLPGLLARLDADQVRNRALAPGPDLLPRILDAVRAKQRAQRRALRRWRLASVAAGVLAVAALGLPPLLGAIPTGTPLLTAAGVTATGTGDLAARPWGTAVALDLTGLPAAPGYLAYAVHRDGNSQVAATWGPTSDGHAAINGATAILRTDLAAIQIRTTDGRPLLTLPA